MRGGMAFGAIHWLLLIGVIVSMNASATQANVSMCMYSRMLGLKVKCEDEEVGSLPTRRSARGSSFHRLPAPEDHDEHPMRNKLPTCASSTAMLICTKDTLDECPESGQVCTLSDRSRCCQNLIRAIVRPSLDPEEAILTHGSLKPRRENVSLAIFLKVANGGKGIPVSFINAKPGDCPQPAGISGAPDVGDRGCWLDANCPASQKCCLEPNPVNNQASRVCREPISNTLVSERASMGASAACNLPIAVGTCTSPVTRYYYDATSGQCKTFQFSGCNGNANNFQSLSACQATCAFMGVAGTPLCPADANTNLNCMFAHADACLTDQDCLGRESNLPPACCMTKCGYRICYAK